MANDESRMEFLACGIIVESGRGAVRVSHAGGEYQRAPLGDIHQFEDAVSSADAPTLATVGKCRTGKLEVSYGDPHDVTQAPSS